MARLLRAAAVVVLFACSAHAAERAVLIYPKEHFSFRRTFYSAHQRELRAELGRRFEVEVHEQVRTATELLAIDVRGAKLLMISGHGDPFAIALGDDGRRTLDAGDLERLRLFFAQLDPDATIVLQSCDVGRGFAWVVKEAAGPRRHVIAGKGTVPRDGLAITSVDPVDAQITCDGASGPWDCTIRL